MSDFQILFTCAAHRYANSIHVLANLQSAAWLDVENEGISIHCEKEES